MLQFDEYFKWIWNVKTLFQFDDFLKLLKVKLGFLPSVQSIDLFHKKSLGGKSYLKSVS